MKKYTRTEAITRMNCFGESNTPYLFVIDFEEEQCIVEALHEIDASQCQFRIGTKNNIPYQSAPSLPAIEWEATLPSFGQYRQAFDLVINHLKRGDSFLTNLTTRIPIHTNLSLEQIFRHAHAPYCLWLKDELVCFSPEPFVSVKAGEIRSYPMKGTIDADSTDAAKQLLENRKETAEHATIVDLIRNDLSRIANHVCVEKYRYIEEIRTHQGGILQTSSAIKAQLPATYAARWGNLLFELLPAGSITGAPKKRTVEIIREAEHIRRGYYTGVMGYFDKGTLESAVMIRFIEQHPDGKYYYRAGGGITAQSIAEAEYEEIRQKTYVPIR